MFLGSRWVEACVYKYKNVVKLSWKVQVRTLTKTSMAYLRDLRAMISLAPSAGLVTGFTPALRRQRRLCRQVAVSTDRLQGR
jgi:hypothetical protein